MKTYHSLISLTSLTDSYLSYLSHRPNSRDEAGMARLFRDFSRPGGGGQPYRTLEVVAHCFCSHERQYCHYV
jgi:phosphoketolase